MKWLNRLLTHLVNRKTLVWRIRRTTGWSTPECESWVSLSGVTEEDSDAEIRRRLEESGYLT